MARLSDLRRKVERLSQQRALVANPSGGVIVMAYPHETNESVLARAAAAGRRGGLLVAPPPVDDIAAWEEATVAEQARLAAEAEAEMDRILGPAAGTNSP
jgi:hypothetical protein